jgi:TBC1 domain family protein 5
LFVWCKANPDVSYKQGMNELLASIVWVYFHEAVAASFDPSNEYFLIKLEFRSAIRF